MSAKTCKITPMRNCFKQRNHVTAYNSERKQSRLMSRVMELELTFPTKPGARDATHQIVYRDLDRKVFAGTQGSVSLTVWRTDHRLWARHIPAEVTMKDVTVRELI
jgi:hypothetical protein